MTVLQFSLMHKIAYLYTYYTSYAQDKLSKTIPTSGIAGAPASQSWLALTWHTIDAVVAFPLPPE